MFLVIINGKHIDLPKSGIIGSEKIKSDGQTWGKRDGEGSWKSLGAHWTKTVQDAPPKCYTKDELMDKRGNPVKISTLPNRIQATTYYGKRSPISKAIIKEQVYDVAENLYKNGVNFDEEDTDWLVIPKYPLPDKWRNANGSNIFSPLLIVFPTEYPEIPPQGFYLMRDLPCSPYKRFPHFIFGQYHEADKTPLSDGSWEWYPDFNKRNWKPAQYLKPGDWKQGDNLWTYLTMITEALSTPEE